MLFYFTVSGELFRVDWRAENSLSDLALLGGSTHSGLSRLLTVPFEELDRYIKVPTFYFQNLCVLERLKVAASSTPVLLDAHH